MSDDKCLLSARCHTEQWGHHSPVPWGSQCSRKQTMREQTITNVGQTRAAHPHHLPFHRAQLCEPRHPNWAIGLSKCPTFFPELLSCWEKPAKPLVQWPLQSVWRTCKAQLCLGVLGPPLPEKARDGMFWANCEQGSRTFSMCTESGPGSWAVFLLLPVMLSGWSIWLRTISPS